jgi:hypothetical protein
MNSDLTTSAIDRQNILNNPYALREIEKAAGVQGIPFEGKSVLLKEQVAAFFDVTVRTVENYLDTHASELGQNGYEVLSGKRLKDIKLAITAAGVPETDFGNLKSTPQLSVFDFRAFLNLAMLMRESSRAGLLRRAILDIVIDTINQRTGGSTKYINQRDEDFIHAAFAEEDYRRHFTGALDRFVDLGKIKYAIYTDRVYLSIFREKSYEYRKVLRLSARASVRDTFYSEILDLIASFEAGLADALKTESERLGRKLRQSEVDHLFAQFETQAHWRPLVERARNKMASRDLAFRDALHIQLRDYITPLQRDEFERFLGEKSMELAERLEQAKDVMKRLKVRE